MSKFTRERCFALPNESCETKVSHDKFILPNELLYTILIHNDNVINNYDDIIYHINSYLIIKSINKYYYTLLKNKEIRDRYINFILLIKYCFKNKNKKFYQQTDEIFNSKNKNYNQIKKRISKHGFEMVTI